MTRRLYRSNSNKVIAGICGGLGEHFDVDPTLMRLIAVVAGLASAGVAVLFYLIAWLVIPLPAPGEIISGPGTPMDPVATPPRTAWRTYLPGLILIGIGVILLLPMWIPGFHWHDIWPLVLVLLGLVLILRNGHHQQSTSNPQSDDSGLRGRDGGIRP